MNYSISSWLPVLLWAALIFGFSAIPALNSGLGLWDFILRKIAHMMEFGVLTLLLARAFHRTKPEWTRLVLIGVSATLSLLYACSDEYHQGFVLGRTASVGDVIIDACGMMVAILVARRYFAETNI